MSLMKVLSESSPTTPVVELVRAARARFIIWALRRSLFWLEPQNV